MQMTRHPIVNELGYSLTSILVEMHYIKYFRRSVQITPNLRILNDPTNILRSICLKYKGNTNNAGGFIYSNTNLMNRFGLGQCFNRVPLSMRSHKTQEACSFINVRFRSRFHQKGRLLPEELRRPWIRLPLDVGSGHTGRPDIEPVTSRLWSPRRDRGQTVLPPRRWRQCWMFLQLLPYFAQGFLRDANQFMYKSEL